MTQNVYDNPEFFEGYSQLGRSVEGLDGAAEWASIRALLPDLKGKRVVDLGCGFGWFCRFAWQEGAAGVLGFDISENMLARAKATSDAAISYAKADLEVLELPEASFDLAYSSLAFHYLKDLDALLARVHAALVTGGQLVFSIEHPIYMAPVHPGWSKDADGRPTWPVNGYLDEGPRTTDWLAKGVVKQHRTMGTLLNILIGLGFTLQHVEEWGPSLEQVAAHPEWAEERERPMFLLVSARK
jgi:SAM-dependent methyltransferase